MTATLNRADVIKRYELMNIESGAYKVSPVEQLSTEFMHARLKFAEWYDAKSEDEQLLIDEISDRTSCIIDEHEYDSFIDELASYGIENASQFEDAFEMELEGYGEHIYAKFAEEICEMYGYESQLPSIFTNCIDYEMVWYSNLQYDYITFEFNNNTYIFRNHF